MSCVSGGSGHDKAEPITGANAGYRPRRSVPALGNTMNTVDTERVAQLCPDLRPLLEAELAAGNSVVDTWAGWPHRDSLYIQLGSPFRVRPERLPEGVRFVAIEDPHYWKSEFVCDRTHHAIACKFE